MSIAFLRRIISENHAESMSPLGDAAQAPSGVLLLAAPDHLTTSPASQAPKLYTKGRVVRQPDGTIAVATYKTTSPPTPPRPAFGDRTNQQQ